MCSCETTIKLDYVLRMFNVREADNVFSNFVTFCFFFASSNCLQKDFGDSLL